MDSTKRIALIAIGLFLGTVVTVLVVLRGGSLLAPDEPATVLALSDCDLQQRPCSVTLPRGGVAELALVGRPVKPMQDFTLRLATDGIEVKKVLVSFTGVGMNMGLNRFALRPAGDEWMGQAILPICVRNRMEWEARLRLSTPQGVYEAPFRFATQKQ